MANVDAALKMWVGKLPQECTEDVLLTHFSQMGNPPTQANILHPGTACLVYGSNEEVTNAISTFNGSDIGGNLIQCDTWTKKEPGKGKGKMDPWGGKGDKGKGKMDPWGGKGKGKMDWMWAMMDPWSMWGMGGKGWGGGGGGGGSWGGGGKSGPENLVMQLSVDSTSKICEAGFGTEAPAIMFEKGHDVFGCASNVLGEIVGDLSEMVQVIHDPDAEQYPEIGAAVKAASGEVQCFAIASCPSAGKWAVGCAPGWKHRESTAKLALAVAFAIESPQNLHALRKWYPDFVSLCNSIMGGAGKKKGAGGAAWPSEIGGGGAGGLAGGEATPANVPPVHWVTMGADSKLALLGMVGEAPVIVHYGKTAKASFSNAHSIVSELVDDMANVTFTDDPDWEKTGEIGESLKAAYPDVDGLGLCVAKSETLGSWAVGCGSNWKFRESAAKLALGLSLAGGAGKLDEFSTTYPEFGKMCAAAGLTTGSEPAAKARKVA